MQNRILVTGGTGYLGSHLIRALDNSPYTILVPQRSSTKYELVADLMARIEFVQLPDSPMALARLLSRRKVDTIFHAATQYGPEKALETNYRWSAMLFDAATLSGVKSFLNVDTTLPPSLNEYAASKGRFKEYILQASDKGGPAVVNLRMEHFFGPKDGRFVSEIANQLRRGVPEIRLTPGNQIRDFIFIDDAVRACKIVMQVVLGSSGPRFQNISIGTGIGVSIREIVEMLKRLSKNRETKLNFGARPYRKHEPMSSIGDPAIIRSWGWTQQFNLEQGLRATYEGISFQSNNEENPGS